MRISGIKTKLSSNDIKSIFDEFIKVEGLKINNIELNNSIKVEGSYEKKIKISFSATIEIINVIDSATSTINPRLALKIDNEHVREHLKKVNEELTNLSVYNFIYDPDMVEKIKQLNTDKISLENKIKSLEDTKEWMKY